MAAKYEVLTGWGSCVSGAVLQLVEQVTPSHYLLGGVSIVALPDGESFYAAQAVRVVEPGADGRLQRGRLQWVLGRDGLGQPYNLKAECPGGFFYIIWETKSGLSAYELLFHDPAKGTGLVQRPSDLVSLMQMAEEHNIARRRAE